MGDQSIISALLLGIIEGLTEFIPVSSTAHVLLAGHFLGFKSPGNTFAVLIQLGAILAILLVYFQSLYRSPWRCRQVPRRAVLCWRFSSLSCRRR